MIIITVAITQIISTMILNYEQQGAFIVDLEGERGHDGRKSEELRCKQTGGAGRARSPLEDQL